jgi:ATP-dependent Clp protease ATP-binding subunit ClpB
MTAIRRTFRPELLNRLDDIVIFNALEPEQIESIVDMHLQKLAERAASAGMLFSWDESVLRRCASHAADAAYGARPALRAIDELVAGPLGKLLLDTSSDKRSVHARISGEHIVFEDQSIEPNRQEPEPV